MESDDSCSDLFITQSCFRSNVETQEASNAADFLDKSLDISLELPTGDVVEYLDFTEEHRKEYAKIAAENAQSSTAESTDDNVLLGQEPFVPLVPDLFDDEDVLPDEVLAAALDASEALQTCNDRHAKPVSANTVKENSTKGYVFFSLQILRNFFGR